MPGKVGVKIKAGRNLPVMDRGSDTTDAYVEIKLGNVTHKTDVFRKSLNPQWNTDWFRFEVDDAELQDEPLQIRLMDYDTYSANDAIGKVNISLNPLCLETSGQATQGKGTVLSGWIPVFDTMHGIRGEVNVIVKVDLFSDLNKFRQSSCGIQFFHSPCIPHGYRAQVIHGFVEELVVNDDPEYQWIDKIRTPRASNEARQVVFLRLSGQVQRKMGLKAINMGANAVIGYTQCFDLEGDVGVVARGIGTAVSLIRESNFQSIPSDNALIEERTLKYLEFLTGIPKRPESKLQLRKSRSSTLFELKRSSDGSFDDGYIMLNLLRQEDDRGEKKVKKFKHHMRRITNSSKNLLNEKYTNLVRKISYSCALKKSSDNITKSLNTLFTSSVSIKEDNSPNFFVHSSFNMPKLSFKAITNKEHVFKNRSLSRPSLKERSTHYIVRSISDDSAVKNSIIKNMGLSLSTTSAPFTDKFEDNTRSSPNVQAEKETNLSRSCTCTKTQIGFKFGQFSNQEPLLKSKEIYQELDECSTLKSSSTSTSHTVSEGSIATNEEEKFVNNCKLSSMVKSEDTCITTKQSYYIDSLKNSLSHMKVSNQQKQDFMMPDSTKCTTSNNIYKLSSTHSKRPILHGERNIKKSGSLDLSHPDILIETHPSSYHERRFSSKLFSSLTNLSAHNCTSSFKLELNPPCYKYFDMANSATSPNFPIFQIYPSTPTPTESDNSELSPINDLPSNIKFLPSRSLNVSLSPLNSSLRAYTVFGKNEYSSKQTCKTCFSNALSNRSLDINYTNKTKSSSLAPPSSLLYINRHRSLNELNSSSAGFPSTAITDSPRLKRFASTTPASTTGVVASATGSATGSRSKLSLSPSKVEITPSSNSSAAQSEHSMTSSASTVQPKDIGEIYRRSSDSDLSVTPKGNSFCVASERLVAATALMRLNQPAVVAGKSSTATDSTMDMLEYPFLTLTKYPPGFILHIGATVAARSVKLLERLPNPNEPEIRDSWWTELRMEIRSHARALGCNVVLGYSESTTISDDVCVLSATGTAAVINMTYNRSTSQTDIFGKNLTTSGVAALSSSLEDRDMLKDIKNGGIETTNPNKEVLGSFCNNTSGYKKLGLPLSNVAKYLCTMCHIPYNVSSVPFNVKMRKCAVCRKGRVPDVLLATLEVPEYLQVTGRGCFMQAQVVRSKKDLRSELNAKEISDGLPFLEYELHRVLINKLKAKGMNAVFGLKAQVAIGERMIALIATGTALFLTALPSPQVPKIVAGNSWTDKQKLNELQKKLQETFERNQEVYQLKCIDPDVISGGGLYEKQSDTDESDEEVVEIDLNCGNKDACVLEVDDIEDLEIISLLIEPYPPEGFHVVNTQMVPGIMDMEAVKNLQMFTQVWRAKLDVSQNINSFPKHFQRLLQTIYFKLRTMIPCAICDLRFRLDLPDSDQIQLLVTGMALGLGDANNKIKYRRKTVTNGSTNNTETINNPTIGNTSTSTSGAHGQKRTLQEDDYIFPLDEDQTIETPTPTTNIPPYGTHSLKVRKTSPSRISSTTTATTMSIKSGSASFRNRYFPLRDRHGVDITPLNFIPGSKIEKYLGNLNFFFIRESTSIRENGGISGFVHGFITELLAVVRAHIAALGGNAMVSFYMTELILVDNQHKNQGQCLISIGGDAVYTTYCIDD